MIRLSSRAIVLLLAVTPYVHVATSQAQTIITSSTTVNGSYNLAPADFLVVDGASAPTLTFNNAATNGIEAMVIGGSQQGSLVVNSGTVANTGAYIVLGAYDGTLIYGGDAYLGLNPGPVATASVSGSGSQWTNLADLNVGCFGNGALNINTGGWVSNSAGIIARDDGGSGTVTVSGSGAQWTNSLHLYVGLNGSGALTINSGGSVSNSIGFIAVDPGSAGTVTVSGNGSQWTNSDLLVVGNYGNGTLTVSASGSVTSNGGYIGYSAGSVGAITVSGSGSRWNDRGALYVGGSSTAAGGMGMLAVSGGGTVSVAGGVMTIWGTGVANLNAGGTIQASSINLAGGTINFGGGNLIGPISVASGTMAIADGTTATLTGAVTNSGTLTTSGAGTLELTGVPTWNSGSALQVSGGRLRLNLDTGSATVGSGVTATIAAGSVLELAGTVSALASGPNRVNIHNASQAAAGGLQVTGTHQQVGGIDGVGTTQISAGRDLTANSIIQSALIIGGAAGSPSRVTIDASDAAGNPLTDSPASLLGNPGSAALILANSSTTSGPFGAGGSSSANLSRVAGDGADLAAVSPGHSAVGGSPSSVPEPSTLLLMVLALASAVSQTTILRRPPRVDA